MQSQRLLEDSRWRALRRYGRVLQSDKVMQCHANRGPLESQCSNRHRSRLPQSRMLIVFKRAGKPAPGNGPARTRQEAKKTMASIATPRVPDLNREARPAAVWGGVGLALGSLGVV